MTTVLAPAAAPLSTPSVVDRLAALDSVLRALAAAERRATPGLAERDLLVRSGADGHELARVRADGLIAQDATGMWSLTPRGRALAAHLRAAFVLALRAAR